MVARGHHACGGDLGAVRWTVGGREGRRDACERSEELCRRGRVNEAGWSQIQWEAQGSEGNARGKQLESDEYSGKVHEAWMLVEGGWCCDDAVAPESASQRSILGKA